MITYKKGNLLDEPADALVNAVNTVGVMGKGIALQFKQRFPDMYKAYQQAANNNELLIGKMHIVSVKDVYNVKYIINFPTKQHWRSPSKLEWIKDGLIDLSQQIVNYSIKSIALPPLGCGLGGLQWSKVRPLIEEYLKDLNAEIIVYEPI